MDTHDQFRRRGVEQRTPVKIIEEKVEEKDKGENKPLNPFMNIFDMKRVPTKAGKEKEGIEDLLGFNKKRQETKPKQMVQTGGKKNISSEFELGKQIGSGATSVVRRVVHKETGVAYAMKTFTNNTDNSRLVKQESYALELAQHPDVIKLIGVKNS
jgi:serine/threonine protein kinase